MNKLYIKLIEIYIVCSKFSSGYDSRPIVQFLKYGFVGGIATLIHAVFFTTLNETVLPANLSQSAGQRGWNFFWSNAIAFCFANFIGYLANRRWVFRPGRHDRWVELWLFYLVSIFAFLTGTPLGSYFVSKYALNEYLVYYIVIAVSIFINYFGRKYWVFYG